jgi:hypothetical protein
LDEKIERFCMEHPKANERFFNETHWERCILLAKWQARFETWMGTLWVWPTHNNIYGFRSPSIRKEWSDNFWVIWIYGGFLVFKDQTNSIKFYVNRFYTFDKYKTIRQITHWGRYVSPVTWRVFYLQGFTHTLEHQDSYHDYLRNFYFKNLWN